MSSRYWRLSKLSGHHQVARLAAIAAALTLCWNTAETMGNPLAAPYKPDHAAPLKATTHLLFENEHHKQFRVEFNGIKADRVPGFLYVPRAGSGKFPAVVLQYGSGGNKASGYIVQIGRFFADRGFVVLTIDAPRRGERAPKEKHWYDLLDFERGHDAFVQYLGDYSRAVDYLESRPDVNARDICFVGISWGAITGITYVAHDPRIRAMVSLVGGGDVLPHLPPKLPDKVKDAVRELDPVNHVGQIAPRPLLLINVKHDRLIPRSCAEALHRAAGKGSRVLWLDSDHNFRNQDRAKLAQSVVDFLQQALALPVTRPEP